MANTPAFCYDNIFEQGTLSASSEAAGFPKENAVNWKTYDFWQPAAINNWIAVDAGSPVTCDYAAMFAHDSHTQGSIVSLQGADNAAFSSGLITPVSFSSLTTSAPVVRTFATTAAKRYWRYYQVGGTAPTSIGVLAAGTRLDMQRGMRTGFAPPLFARAPQLLPNRAIKGAFLGQAVRRQGVSFTASFNNLTPAWLRANWAAFQDHFERKPFFFTWDPGTYDDDAAFAWVNGTPGAPVYQTPQYMALSLKMLGLMR